MQISISIEPYLVDKKEKLTQYIVDIISLKQKMAVYGNEISLHFDYFKPNLEVFALVQSFTNQIEIDLHLMQESVPSVKGFRSVCFDAVDLKNAENGTSKNALINNMKMVEPAQRGLVLDLGYKIDGYEDLIRQASYIIVMTVKCGKSGQAFQSSPLQLIEQIRAINPTVTIIIDGGINENNVNLLKKASVNVAVVGSYAKKGYENADFENSINRLLRV